MRLLTALRSPRRVARVALRRGNRLRRVVMRRVLPDRRLSWSPTEFSAALGTHSSAAAGQPPTAAMVRFLDDRSADRVPHTIASFKEHLLGTYRILSAWNQPGEVCWAGLFHSVYSTDSFPHALLAPSERPELRALIGQYAEELVFLFATIDKVDLRRKLRRLSHLPAAGIELVNHKTGERRRFDRRLIGQLLVILVADHADQSCDLSLAPSVRLSNYSRLLRLARDAVDPVPPVFGRCKAQVRLEDERRARVLYLKGSAQLVSEPRLAHECLSECHRLNPWVAEPLVLLAQLGLASGRHAEACREAEEALRLLREWATAWDKRRSWDEWLSAAQELRQVAAEKSE